MTLALARELAPHIPVAMIQPAMIDPSPDLIQADIDAVIARTPLRRAGTPADVNRLILDLLEGTSFVTGAVFRVDSGRFLGPDSEGSRQIDIRCRCLIGLFQVEDNRELFRQGQGDRR
jgi:pteridine reductase